jgi:hypothetical protein
VVELSDVKLNESDESEEEEDMDLEGDDELDLEHIVVDDFLLTEDGSVDVERAMQIKASKTAAAAAGASAGGGAGGGGGNRPSVKATLKASQQAQGAGAGGAGQRLKSPRNIPLSTPLSGIGIDSSDAAIDSGVGSGNDSSSVRSGTGRRGTYRDNTTRITAEKRLENLTRASNSRQISVNIVDKTSRTRRPSAGSLSDSSTGGRSGTVSPTSGGEQRVVRPKVHDRKVANARGGGAGGGRGGAGRGTGGGGGAVGYSGDSGDAAGESSASSVAKVRGRQLQV